jgi:hypothetical protein
MPWIKQRNTSLLGGLGVNDVQPSGVVGTGEAAGLPVHTLTIAIMGAPLVDNDRSVHAAPRPYSHFVQRAGNVLR